MFYISYDIAYVVNKNINDAYITNKTKIILIYITMQRLEDIIKLYISKYMLQIKTINI